MDGKAALIKALEWYENRAKSLEGWEKKSPEYTVAICTELSLDGGKRARRAIDASK